jgi:hypothetical protein
MNIEEDSVHHATGMREELLATISWSSYQNVSPAHRSDCGGSKHTVLVRVRLG